MKKTLAYSLIGIVIAVAIGGTYVYTQNNNTSEGTVSSSSNKKSVAKKESKSTKKTTKSTKEVKNNDEPMTREGAVASAEALLQSVNEAPDKKMTDAQRLDLLQKDKNNYTKVLTPETLNKVRLVDFMKTDARGGQLTAQALINVTHSVKEAGNKELKVPEYKTFKGIVYFDKEAKTATVPVDLFTTSSTNLGLEFIYRDGKWMFQPYSLISEITIRISDQESLTGTAEGSVASNSSSTKATKAKQSSESSAKETSKSSTATTESTK